MLTHLQQSSSSHPSATSFVRAPLCFATSPSAHPGGDAGISASSAPVTFPRSSEAKACQGESPARLSRGAACWLHPESSTVCMTCGTTSLCGAHLPPRNCTWPNPKLHGHLAPSVWRTQGGRHLGEDSSQAAPCKVSSCPQVQRDGCSSALTHPHLTYQSHCGTGPLIHQRPDNLQSPGRNIRGLPGI